MKTMSLMLCLASLADSALVHSPSSDQPPPKVAGASESKTVTGHVRSRTGKYHPSDMRVHGWFPSLDIAWGAPVVFEQQGSEWVGKFEFEVGRRRGRMMVAARTGTDPFIVNPEESIVSVGDQDVEFLCEDDTPVFGVKFRVLDADTCAPIPEAGVLVERVTSPTRRVELRNHDGFLEGSEYRWIASRPATRSSSETNRRCNVRSAARRELSRKSCSQRAGERSS